MQDKRIYPFKRNRFYPGKLLSSYDFLAEQRYFCDKHRFINRTVFGAGVVSGMRVYKIDDFSIMIESGFALDFDGREIIMEKDEVKRLFTIDGFTKTTSGKLSLYICYLEERITPVFAVDKQEQGEKLEYNHIAEGCRLFVTDKSDADEREPEPDFIIRRILMQDRHYLVALETPEYACRGFAVCPSVTAVKLSDDDAELSFSAKLQAPAFAFSGGGEKGVLQFEIKAGQLKQGESFSRQVELIPQGNLNETAILIEAGQASATSGGNALKLREDVRVPVYIGDSPPGKLIRRAVSQIPLKDLFGNRSNGLKLAEISVVRNGESCMIETVAETAINVTGTPLQQKYSDEYGKYYSPAPAKPQMQAEAANFTISPQSREKDVATGVTEIPLGLKTRAGEVCYSGHIIHQLGPGNVFVSVGLESIKPGETKEASQLTIYGDTNLFEDADISVQTAVCVDATRGTFRIAARLMEQINSIYLTVRWVALRLPEAERYASLTNAAKKRVFVNPATKALSPREKWAIHIGFEGMDPATCRFEVMEASGGSVTSDGVYTAPNAEGVYDVKISVVDEPNLTAYAYAVVRRKED